MSRVNEIVLYFCLALHLLAFHLRLDSINWSNLVLTFCKGPNWIILTTWLRENCKNRGSLVTNASYALNSWCRQGERLPLHIYEAPQTL